jgi:hypothetical protein
MKLEKSVGTMYQHLLQKSHSPVEILHDKNFKFAGTISQLVEKIETYGMKLQIKMLFAALSSGLATMQAIGTNLDAALVALDSVSNVLYTTLDELASTRAAVNQLSGKYNSLVNFELDMREKKMYDDLVDGMGSMLSGIPVVGPILGGAMKSLWAVGSYLTEDMGESILYQTSMLQAWSESMIANEVKLISATSGLRSATDNQLMLDISLLGLRNNLTCDFLAVDQMLKLYDTLGADAVFDVTPEVTIFVEKYYHEDGIKLPLARGFHMCFTFPYLVGTSTGSAVRNTHCRMIFSCVLNKHHSLDRHDGYDLIDLTEHKNYSDYSFSVSTSVVLKDTVVGTGKFDNVSILGDTKINIPYKTCEKLKSMPVFTSLPVMKAYLHAVSNAKWTSHDPIEIMYNIVSFACTNTGVNAYSDIPGISEKQLDAIVRAYHSEVTIEGYTWYGSTLHDLEDMTHYYAGTGPYAGGGNDRNGNDISLYLQDWLNPYQIILDSNNDWIGGVDNGSNDNDGSDASDLISIW